MDTLIPINNGKVSQISIENFNFVLERFITKDQLKIALWRMNLNKAPGFDNQENFFRKSWNYYVNGDER